MGDAPFPSNGERGLLMVGRPTVHSPELQAELCKLMAEGMYLEPACDLVGVAFSTVREWLTRTDEPFLTFSAALKQAEATAERESMARMRVGENGWQGAATFLERRKRARWGREAQHDQTQHAPPIIQVQLPESDRVRKLEEALRKAGIEVPE